jgi:hypothetical protein
MRESLTHEALNEAMKNCKSPSSSPENNDSHRPGTASDQLPKLSIFEDLNNKDNGTKDHGPRPVSDTELSNTARDVANSILHDRNGLLNNLPESERKDATAFVQSVADRNDPSKSTADAVSATAKDDTAPKDNNFTGAAKAGDRFNEQDIENMIKQGGRIAGGIMGAIRGYQSGGIAGAFKGAIQGYLSGEHNADTAIQLWRALPPSARQAVVGVLNRVF